MWHIRQLRDKAEILARLQSDRLYAAYAIGDLEPAFFRQCRWWLAEEGGRWALILLFRGLQPPALFCMGEPEGVAAALDRARLPKLVYLTARAAHWPMVEAHYRLRFVHRMLRMVVDGRSFRPAAHEAAFRLRMSDLDALRALYRHGGGDAFAPYQLQRGVFYGLAVNGELVSVAGTHLVSPTYGLAALGNVFTHPAHRGHGYATICTSAVTEALLAEGLEVVLNVNETNELAVHLYRRLGYRTYCRFLEGIGESRRVVKQ